MESEYQEYRKRLRSRFAILYIGSIVLLLLAFAALWFYVSPPRETVTEEMPSENTEAIELLNMDESLHKGMVKLDELDLSYSKLLANSAKSTSLDSLNNLINTSQIVFSNLLDSIYSKKKLLKNEAEIEKSNKIFSAFISALNYRKSNNSLRMALVGNNNLSGDTSGSLALKMDLLNKEAMIKNLEDQLKFQNKLSKNVFTVQPQFQSDIETEPLQSNSKRHEDSIKVLLNVYSTLLKENSSLTSQLNKLKTNTGTADAALMSNKINSLNEKIDDLNAEMALAKIDCNLTRANGKDIIYNSKQRRDLLQESLNSLKNLSTSDNPVIQRKVKEKMQLLQDIAATVRD